MRVFPLMRSICQRIARLVSFGVTLLALLSLVFTGFREDTLLMGLFYVLPILSFPVTLLSFRWLRLCAALQWALALGYLADYSVLEWRTCSELGYCRGMTNTVLQTLTAWRVEALFVVALA